MQHFHIIVESLIIFSQIVQLELFLLIGYIFFHTIPQSAIHSVQCVAVIAALYLLARVGGIS